MLGLFKSFVFTNQNRVRYVSLSFDFKLLRISQVQTTHIYNKLGILALIFLLASTPTNQMSLNTINLRFHYSFKYKVTLLEATSFILKNDDVCSLSHAHVVN